MGVWVLEKVGVNVLVRHNGGEKLVRIGSLTPSSQTKNRI